MGCWALHPRTHQLMSGCVWASLVGLIPAPAPLQRPLVPVGIPVPGTAVPGPAGKGQLSVLLLGGRNTRANATPAPLGNCREMCYWEPAGGNNIPKPFASPAFPAARRRARPIFPLTMPFYQGVYFYYGTG